MNFFETMVVLQVMKIHKHGDIGDKIRNIYYYITSMKFLSLSRTIWSGFFL